MEQRGEIGTMAKSSIKVSQSKVNLWRKCARAYHYKYVEKLRRKRIVRPLYFGRIVHEMIEFQASDENPLKVIEQKKKELSRMFAVEREEYLETIEDARIIMTEYFKFWEKDPLVYVSKKGETTEHRFEIEIADGIVATGIIDAFAKKKKLRWLVEHKSFNRMPSEDHRWRNLQSVVYFRINDMLGWPKMDGVLWDYVWSKTPTRPQLLKDGKLSQKFIRSLPLAAEETIKELGLKVKDNAKFLESLARNRRDYFTRIYSPISKSVVDTVFSDFVDSARDIADRGHKVKTRSIAMHCDWCDFEPICRAELQGSDADFVKKKEYIIHENEEQKVEKERGE